MKKIYPQTKSILSLFLVLCTTTLFSQNYYVSPGGSDSNNGLTNTTPFKSITKAAGLVTPGNTVFLMKGVYAQGYIIISKSGSPGKYITYTAYPGDSPKITFTGSLWNLIIISASYIIFENIELEGNNANLTYSGALASYNDKNGGGNNTALYGQYNTNAISVNGDGSKGIFPTHVTIRNCKVHDFSAGGIGSGYADYLTVEGNTVYNNAWYTMYACSGISIINTYNSDNSTNYKIIVRNNICHDNKDLIPWVSITPHRLSDGNGIIIDVNQRTPIPTNSAGIPYTGRTLVENNV
ncbi:MAG: hypothetical protein H0W84_06310, partial [Bacteroidetes bacterium]|nr:hypothetical protein [Bacteroidota bacterium]